MLAQNKKKALIIIIVITALVNMTTFCFAFPQTFTPEEHNLARDFSAYYIGGWRLFHNPTEIYVGGSRPGDYQILPMPQTFKYTPSFLILITPFLALKYQDALTAFDFLQVALIPALAFFVYKLLKEKNYYVGAFAAVLILLAPLPTPPINQAAIDLLHYRVYSLNAQSFAPTYFLGYLLGNAHVLQTILLVGASYFGFTKKPWISALLWAFGTFDPRAALFALPLLLWYNRKKIIPFVTGAVAFLALTNLPFFLYKGIGFIFLRTETQGFIISQMYPYDWLPLYTIATLMVVEIISAGTLSRKNGVDLFAKKAQAQNTTVNSMDD